MSDILSLPDYKVEFDRYSDPALPVCGISFEEAVDFFMNFDKKDFENPRLHYKKDSFTAFYNEIEQRMKTIGRFTALDAEDLKLMETLLQNGLPDRLTDEVQELNIILIISIGNSMGWPYGHFIDYDAANLDLLESKDDFLHTKYTICLRGKCCFPTVLRLRICFYRISHTKVLPYITATIWPQ